MLAGAQTTLDGKMGSIPPRARKPVLVVATVALVALLAVLVGVSRPERDPQVDVWPAPPPAPPGQAQWDLIPPEELFLPDEPDFVPGVIPGREQRAEWTAEDAEPWWQNPLAGGEEQWRARIERMVDEIMESVP